MIHCLNVNYLTHLIFMTFCFLLGRGRPIVNIDREQLDLFHRKGYTAQRMASHFGCSVHTGKT